MHGWKTRNSEIYRAPYDRFIRISRNDRERWRRRWSLRDTESHQPVINVLGVKPSATEVQITEWSGRVLEIRNIKLRIQQHRWLVGNIGYVIQTNALRTARDSSARLFDR